VLPWLAARHRVMLFDMAGSTAANAAFYTLTTHDGIEDYAEDLVALLDRHGIGRAIYLGHGAGGTIGLVAARARPELFQRLVLLGASPCHLEDGAYRGGFTASELAGMLSAMARNYRDWVAMFAPAVAGIGAEQRAAADEVDVVLTELKAGHRDLRLPRSGIPRRDLTFMVNTTLTETGAMQSERQKMIAGELYDPLDGELVAARGRARDLCRDLNATRDAEDGKRRRILAALFGAGGDTVWMQPPFFCDYGSNIELGERVFFNFNCVVLDVCPVRIGSFTLFGPAVQIYTPMHPFDAELRRRQEFGKPVEIGSDVWVGGGAIILPGVRIGSRAVIGAGSVVSRSIPDGVFAAGNPCRVVREITD